MDILMNEKLSICPESINRSIEYESKFTVSYFQEIFNSNEKYLEKNSSPYIIIYARVEMQRNMKRIIVVLNKQLSQKQNVIILS